jgi:hypothetical protein
VNVVVLLRQIRQSVAPEASQHYRRPDPDRLVQRGPQLRQAIGVLVLFVLAAEGLQVTEIARIRRVYDAPEVGKPVFDRSAGQCDPEPDIHALCRIGQAHAGRFDLLRLVEYCCGKPHLTEVAVVITQCLVGRHHPVGAVQRPDIETRLASCVIPAQRP